MRRGFKTEAEHLAEATRSAMGLKPTDRLDATVLANHAGAGLRRADELTLRSKLEDLEARQPGAFSACTFQVGGRPVIVYSPLASEGRKQSNITHEVAHLLLNHSLQTVQQLNGVSFFTCDPDEEQEANWLAGCLLLPRTLLLSAGHRGLSVSEISRKYVVSRQMAEFRIRATGVLRQIKRSRKTT